MLKINVCLLLILGIVIASCKNDSPKQTELINVTIGLQNNCAVSTLLIAKANKYFEEHGIEPHFKYYASGKLAYKALLAGQLDYATVADMPIATHGVDVNARMITQFSTTTTGAWIVARTDRGIKTPNDLSGKIIGTQKNSAVHYFLMKFIEQNELKDCTVKFFAAKDLPQALADGKIDAFSMRNPFANQAKEMLPGKTVEFFSDCYLQHFVLAVRDDGPAAKTDASTRIIKALIDAETFLAEFPEKAMLTVVEELPGDRLDEVREDFSKYSYRVALSQNLISVLENQAFLRLEDGKGEIPDFVSILNPSSMKQAAPERLNVLGE